jgi:hypothetical protein
VKSRACTDESQGLTRLASPRAQADGVNCAADCARHTEKLPVPSSLPQLWPPGTDPHLVDAPGQDMLKRGQPGVQCNPGHGLSSEDFSPSQQPSPTTLRRAEVGTHRERLYLHMAGCHAPREITMPDNRAISLQQGPAPVTCLHNRRPAHAQDLPRLVLIVCLQEQFASTASFSVCRAC